tara:strand:- start:1950 stop:2444 length:495 start_codon:yes stop_codon:yes gene_type:complete
MDNYLIESLEDKLKQLRTYESNIYEKWGNRKRIFKITGVDFEIKFCKAEMMLKESLRKDLPKKKIQMVEMMERALDHLNIECEKSGYHIIQPSYKCFCFQDKIAMVCDTDEQMPLMRKIYRNEDDVLFFSIEELFRCIPKDIMELRARLSKLSKDVSFKSIEYK